MSHLKSSDYLWILVNDSVCLLLSYQAIPYFGIDGLNEHYYCSYMKPSGDIRWTVFSMYELDKGKKL